VSESSKPPAGDWADELEQQTLQLRYKVRERLFSGRSEYQRVDVVETAGFGRMLFNDGLAMVSERDEFVYHEMIGHVPLFVHPDPRRVLVIGGGDGGTVREVIRHRSVEHCRLVEIDALVVEACRKELPWTASALDDPRVAVTIGDGVRFVATTDERYDLVLVDSTDPVGPARALFGEEFYANVRRVLRDGGLVVSQAESPFFDIEQQRSLLGILGGRFERVHIYNYANITYPGGLWSFSYAAAGDLCPLRSFDPARVARSGLAFRYYDAAVHRAAFALPVFQAEALRGVLTPIEPGAGRTARTRRGRGAC
jgi:spermidine synthase